MTMTRHFVTFLSPGTFVAEQSTKPIESWDVDKALEMSRDVKERYGATPYGFYFTTRARTDDELDSKVVEKSPLHYIGGRIRTLEEVEADNDPQEEILRSNMRCNGYSRVWESTEGWKWTQPLNDDDVVLEAP